MATPLKIKRSAVSNKRPTISDLQLGELALNTYDGYLFAERDTGGVGIGTTVALLTPWIENFGAQSIYYNNSVGIGTTNATSKLTVTGDALVSGVITATTFSGTSTYAISAGIATALQYPRTFEITGDIVASAISFDGTGNVSLAATIQPNSVGLGTDTTGDYVKSISGTSNQITVTSGTGEGSTPILSLPSNLVIPQDATVIRDLQVNRNLNVNGNITIGGTSAAIFAQELNIFDPDIVLGVRTDGSGNDISNDTTSNHGGVALASTEGTPLVDLLIAGIETNPATYKKIMWFRAGTFAGLGTDAWLINYGVGIGSTQFPTGTRLAAGNVQFTQSDLAVVRNINASGISTLPTLNSTTGTITAVSGTNLNYTGIGTITTLNSTTGTITAVSGTNLNYTGIGTIETLNSTTGTITTVSGTNLNYSGVGTIATLNSTNAIFTNVNSSGITTSNAYYVGATQVISSGRQLQNIASLDATTTATIESAIQQAPNDFNSLNVSGISTLQSTTLIGGGTSTGTVSQNLQVNGGGYFAGVGVATGSIGVGITNPQGTIDIRTSPQWSGFNYGANLVIGGTRNNALGILDSTNSNPWAIGNNAGSLIFAQMPALGNTASVATEAARITTNRNLVIGSLTETGTASQPLQVTGGAYVSDNVGIGTVSPAEKLHVVGDVRVTGVITATTFVGALTGTATSTTNIPNLTGDVTSNGTTTAIAAGVIVDADINASAGIVDTKLATISTALKVSNSATTATNANTASAIVARDASGNFSAGTITANLTGTASSTTNIPNLTGAITSNNTTTSLGSFTSAQLATALTDETGSGSAVFATSPTLVTPSLGAASATSINSSGIVTATQFVTGASGSAIGINTNTISGPATITIDPAAVGDNTGLVVIKGDLQIDGTTTTINSTTVTVDDKNIVLGSGAINDAAADGSGITIESGNGNKTFQFEDTGDNLGSSENLNVASGKVYKVNNTSVLSATTLGSGVVNSSLTSVGTLTQLNVSGISTFQGQIQSTRANSTADGGGQIYLNGATGNRIDFNTNGVAAPTTTTRSAGTKLVLYPGVSASNVDFAIGIEGGTLWSSVAASTEQFKWYAGTTNVATLFGTGELVLGTTAKTGTASQPLQVTGGAYISGNLGVGINNPTARMHLVLSGDTPNPVLQVTRANNSGGGVGNDEVGIAVTIPNTYNSAGVVYGVRSYVNHNLGGVHYAGHFVAAGSAYSNGIGVYAKTTHTDTNGPGFQPAILADAYSNIGVSNSGYAVALQGQTNNYVNNVNLVLTSNYTGSLAQTLVRFERNGSYIGFITCSTTAVSYQTSSSSGLFAPDANTITLNTNSTQRLLVDSIGNLLINSTSATGTASQPLQVTGGAYVSGNLGVGVTTSGNKLRVNKDLGTNDYFNVAQHQSQFQIGRASDNKSLEFAVLDNGTSIIQSKEAGVGYNNLGIQLNANLGVGLTNPSEKLEVNGRTVLTTGTGPFYGLKVKDYSNTTGVYVGSVSGGSAWYIGDSYYYNSGLWRTDKTHASSINFIGGSLEFYTNTGLTAGVDYTPSRKMILDSSGRLLVGTSSSQIGAGANDLLQVSGAIQVVSSTNVYSRLLPTASGLEIIANAYPANLGSTQSIILKSGTSGGGGPSEIARFNSDGNIKLTANAYQALAHKNYGYSSLYGAVVIGATGNNYTTVSLGVDVSTIAGGNFSAQNQVIFPSNGALVPNNAGTNFIGVFSRNSSDSILIGPDTSGGIASGPLTVTGTTVGIGTVIPAEKLHIHSDLAVIRLSGSAASQTPFNIRQGIVGTNNGGFSIYDVNNSATRFAIDPSGNIGIGTNNPTYKLHVVGSFGATTKSFIIDHPTKEGKKLQYGSLEGPELGVYVRGRTQESIIELPDYWTGLVREETITVNITAIGNKNIWVEKIEDNKVYINSEDVIDCFYTIFGERKDVAKLEVEM